MPVYRAMTSEEGSQVDTAISTSGVLSEYQAEDLPDAVKARTSAGLPKAVHSRSELHDTDYVLIVDPITGQRFETDWASAKMSGLDAYVSISDQATRSAQSAAQSLPRGELNDAGKEALGGSTPAGSTPIYEPDQTATLLSDTLALHGGINEAEVEGLVANYIKGDGAEILGAFEAAGLGRDALGELIGQIEANAEALAFNELSPEDFEYLTWASEANPEIRELIALQGWKASRGTASMSWPEFARRVRAKLSRA